MHNRKRINVHTACIFCNGELGGVSQVRKIATNSDLLIAVNGGVKNLSRIGVEPHAIVGDMDSLEQHPWLNSKDIQLVTFPENKNRCDTELAVEWALKQATRHVILIAATGKRFDHTLGNCALLLRYPGQVFLWDKGLLMRAVTAGQYADITASSNSTVSMVPFSENTEVKTEGLQYAMQNETLNYATHGLSNVATSQTCSVQVNRGALILCVKGVQARWTE